MADYRQVRTLSREQAAYIAGIIDGEGTITLTHIHRSANRQLAVSISSTERKLLDYILHTVGAGRVTNKRIACANHTPSVTYAINDRQALRLIEQVAPFLRTYKAQRAQLVLRDYVHVTPRNGKYTAAQMKARDTFIDTFLSIRANNARLRNANGCATSAKLQAL